MSGNLLKNVWDVWDGFLARLLVSHSPVSSMAAMGTTRELMISRRLLPILLGLCACVALATPARGVVRYVDADAAAGGDGLSWATAYDSLDTALTAAEPGDQIWVAAGRYVGNFTLALGVEVYGGFAGTETELSQRNWTANPTILDGYQTGSVVTSPAGATDTTRIDGFTITNGSGTKLGSYTTYGGGLFLDASSPSIANNTITGNGAHGGGGLYLYNRSSPTIVNNTITGNGAHDDGGGLCLLNSSATIANNTITGNRAEEGGGLYLDESSPTIANTIVAFNSSGIRGFGGTLRYNCVYGNTEYDYWDLADPTGTDGNISSNPLLADLQYGNVHIQPDSPCVDAGSNADTPGDFDMDGELRIQGGTIDIGSDESDGTVWLVGPHILVRVSPAGDDANDGSSWALTKRTVQAGVDAASVLGGEVWVQAGTYYERVTLYPYAYLYGGFAGGETARDQRDWSANVTTLDGEQQGPVVTAQAGYGTVGAVDGFTITNGSGRVSGSHTYGGGMFLSSSLTIANNTIAGNNADGGGGLYLSCSSPTIENNTITGNGAHGGGGLYLLNSSATIVNNTITDNSASWDGGGMYLSCSSPTIENNTITGNSADWGGGGLYLYRSFRTTIANNAITGNNADGGGGGLYLYRSFQTTIANNAITGNGASRGGGLYLLWSSSPTIVNNTITGNGALDGGGLYVWDSSPTFANTIVAFNSSGIYIDYGATPTLRYNCVYGNAEYDYDGLTDPTGFYGNISAAPFFMRNPDDGGDGWGDDPDTPGVDEGANDDFGDLRLLPRSPCIDAGDNEVVPADTLDLDGDGDTTEPLPFDLAGAPRFLDAPYVPDTGNGTPPIVDMGAYEHQTFVLGDCDGNEYLDLIDFASMADCLAGPGLGLVTECNCADMDLDGDVDLRDFAAFQVAFSYESR